jgi:hypothetical protein
MSALIRRIAEKRMPRALLEKRRSKELTGRPQYSGQADCPSRATPRPPEVTAAETQVACYQQDESAPVVQRLIDVKRDEVYHPMDMGGGWLRAFALVATLVAALLLVTTFAESAPGDEPAALRSRLRRIEGAFRDGSAGTLRQSFSETGKVRVDLKELTEEPASYGCGQLQVVFGRIFDENQTREFTFPKDDVTVSAAGTAFARARWTRRSRPGGQEAVDNLTFTLRQESGDWRINEIRSSR